MLQVDQHRSNPAVSIFCASSVGVHQAFTNAAYSLAQALAQREITIINGGGSGLMDITTKSALAHGGRVIAIIPRAMLDNGGEDHNPTERISKTKDVKGGSGTGQPRGNHSMVVVHSMHERKQEMAIRSDGFMALPGGFGTLEEVFEMITWNQINIHRKPVIILNVLNYYSSMKEQFSKGIETGLIHPTAKDIAIFVDGPETLGEHESFDWGAAALEALDSWNYGGGHYSYSWTTRIVNEEVECESASLHVE